MRLWDKSECRKIKKQRRTPQLHQLDQGSKQIAPALQPQSTFCLQRRSKGGGMAAERDMLRHAAQHPTDGPDCLLLWHTAHCWCWMAKACTSKQSVDLLTVDFPPSHCRWTSAVKCGGGVPPLDSGGPTRSSNVCPSTSCCRQCCKIQPTQRPPKELGGTPSPHSPKPSATHNPELP